MANNLKTNHLYLHFNFENRLTKVEYFDGTQTLTLGQYYYDGDGKRIKKVESSQTTIYIYLGWNIIYEKESSTMTETKYIFKADCGCHVGKVVGGTTYFLHVDHLGSLRQETDSSGNTVWASPAIYEPFGDLRGGGPANNEEGHLYTGKLRDTSTGLYYYGMRYYDAKVGRFITEDPSSGNAKIPMSFNLYIFVWNNPLKLLDMDGKCPTTMGPPKWRFESALAGLPVGGCYYYSGPEQCAHSPPVWPTRGPIIRPGVLGEPPQNPVGKPLSDLTLRLLTQKELTQPPGPLTDDDPFTSPLGDMENGSTTRAIEKALSENGSSLSDDNIFTPTNDIYII